MEAIGFKVNPGKGNIVSRPSQPKVLVAMPAYNEEKYISSLVAEARQYGDEVLIVDDGSTDDTSEAARRAGATVIQHQENKGYGAAVQSILAEAKRIAPDVLVLLDADSQHNPHEIPRLTEPILQGFDLVIGSRKLLRDSIPFYRRMGQGVISFFCYILSRADLSDSESGFRAFSNKAVKVLELREDGMSISAETVAKAAEKRLKITEIPISITYTRDGSTLNPVRHGFSVLGRIIAMIVERRPLFFFGLGGIILTLLGFLMGMRVIGIVYRGGEVGTSTVLILVFFLAIGILSIFTGIMRHQLIRKRG